MTSSINDDFNQQGSGSTGVKKERHGINSFLVMLLVLILGGLIFYLASIINSQSYFLIAKEHQLVVEKGYFFPIGSGPFKEEEQALRELYAPIAIPVGAEVSVSTKFNNLGDLDRQLFVLLSEWTKKLMVNPESKQFEMAVFYVERLRKLSGLTGAQQQELNALRGDMAKLQGHYQIAKAADDLQKALKAFREANELGTSDKADLNGWITALEKRQDELRRALAQDNPALLLNKKQQVLPEKVARPIIIPDPAPEVITTKQEEVIVEEQNVVKEQLPVGEAQAQPHGNEVKPSSVPDEVDAPVNDDLRAMKQPLSHTPGSL